MHFFKKKFSFYVFELACNRPLFLRRLSKTTAEATRPAPIGEDEGGREGGGGVGIIYIGNFSLEYSSRNQL